MPDLIDITDIASRDLPPTAGPGLGETRGAGLPLPADAIKQFLANRGMPKTIRFAAAIDARLKIEKPFIVDIHRNAGQVTAEVKELEEFGIGQYTGEALHDLGRTIVELYFSLDARSADLGPDLQRVRSVLHDHIRHIQR